MTVWIVEGNDYEDQAVRSVWSTEALALAEYVRRGSDPYENIAEYDIDPKPDES